MPPKGPGKFPRSLFRSLGRRSLVSFTIQAPAKINLFLHVLGRRPDGYHALDSVFHTIGLYDRVTLEHRPREVSLSCSDPALDTDGNLALRAARLLRERAAAGRGMAIHLGKGIPAGAGLGGGSSDAAAVLSGLNRLWGLGWSTAALAEVAAELGSDVPFFLYGGAARVGGRGEVVTPIPAREGEWCVLLYPGVQVQTSDVFRRYAADASRRLTEGASAPIITRAQAGTVMAPLEREENHLERPAVELAPIIGAALEALRQAGGKRVRMSGSGSAVFSLAPSREAAEETRQRLKMEPDWRVWVVPLVGPVTPSGVQQDEFPGIGA